MIIIREQVLEEIFEINKIKELVKNNKWLKKHLVMYVHWKYEDKIIKKLEWKLNKNKVSKWCKQKGIELEYFDTYGEYDDNKEIKKRRNRIKGTLKQIETKKLKKESELFD